MLYWKHAKNKRPATRLSGNGTCPNPRHSVTAERDAPERSGPQAWSNQASCLSLEEHMGKRRAERIAVSGTRRTQTGIGTGAVDRVGDGITQRTESPRIHYGIVDRPPG
jgi:hypothetical protein